MQRSGPRHSHLNPFAVQTHGARLANCLLALGCRLLCFLENPQGAKSSAFLRKKIRLGYNVCLCKTFSQITFQVRFL